MLPAVRPPCWMAWAPTFSPAARVRLPESESLPTSEPLVIWLVKAGSLSPYTLVLASAVTVMGRAVIARLAPEYVRV